jgi:hypothetical protein
MPAAVRAELDAYKKNGDDARGSAASHPDCILRIDHYQSCNFRWVRMRKDDNNRSPEEVTRQNVWRGREADRD